MNWKKIFALVLACLMIMSICATVIFVVIKCSPNKRSIGMDVGNPNSSQVLIDNEGEVLKATALTPAALDALSFGAKAIHLRKDVANTIGLPGKVLSLDGNVITQKVLQIGLWNMDGTASKTVAHGLGADYIRVVNATAFIRTDSGGLIQPLQLWNPLSSVVDGGIYYLDNTELELYRLTDGLFDQAAYSSTAFNRGIILLTLVQTGWIV